MADEKISNPLKIKIKREKLSPPPPPSPPADTKPLLDNLETNNYVKTPVTEETDELKKNIPPAKSSDEILAELFGVFNATVPLDLFKTTTDEQTNDTNELKKKIKKEKKSSKKHKHKDKDKAKDKKSHKHKQKHLIKTEAQSDQDDTKLDGDYSTNENSDRQPNPHHHHHHRRRHRHHHHHHQQHQDPNNDINNVVDGQNSTSDHDEHFQRDKPIKMEPDDRKYRKRKIERSIKSDAVDDADDFDDDYDDDNGDNAIDNNNVDVDLNDIRKKSGSKTTITKTKTTTTTTTTTKKTSEQITNAKAIIKKPKIVIKGLNNSSIYDAVHQNQQPKTKEPIKAIKSDHHNDNNNLELLSGSDFELSSSLSLSEEDDDLINRNNEFYAHRDESFYGGHHHHHQHQHQHQPDQHDHHSKDPTYRSHSISAGSGGGGRSRSRDSDSRHRPNNDRFRDRNNRSSHYHHDRRTSSRDRDRDRYRSNRRDHSSSRNSRRDSKSHNYKRRSRSRSEPQEVIDKKRLLEIARKNVITMLKNGTLPGAQNFSTEDKEKVLAKMRYGGQSVNELTEFCKKISNGESGNGYLSSVSDDSDTERDGTARPFYHPFVLKDRGPLVMNIHNSTPIPPKSAEQAKQISMLFPVSSGQHHRLNESQWIPVVPQTTTKKTETITKPLTTVTVTTSAVSTTTTITTTIATTAMAATTNTISPATISASSTTTTTTSTSALIKNPLVTHFVAATSTPPPPPPIQLTTSFIAQIQANQAKQLQQLHCQQQPTQQFEQQYQQQHQLNYDQQQQQQQQYQYQQHQQHQQQQHQQQPHQQQQHQQQQYQQHQQQQQSQHQQQQQQQQPQIPSLLQQYQTQPMMGNQQRNHHHHHQQQQQQIAQPSPQIPSLLGTHFPSTNFQQNQNSNNTENIFSTFTGNTDKNLDVTTIISNRLNAIRKLQENPLDAEGIKLMYDAQKDMSQWANSKFVPGQYTGSTGANILSARELTGGFQAWAKRDQLLSTAPVTGGMGMHLLQKMGWRPGEGLGKDKTGSLQPLLLEVKLDKRGLIAIEEDPNELKRQKKNQSIMQGKQNMENKHPVSLLGELAAKRKWDLPFYELVSETAPQNCRQFLFKVTLNGQEYQPTKLSNTKKDAKSTAAKFALQQMGIL